MVLLVASSSLLAMFLTIICFSKTIETASVKKKQLKWIRGESEYGYIDEELEKSLFQRYVFPIWKRLLDGLSKLFQKNRKSSEKSAERNSRLESDLRKAGIRLSPQEYTFLKIMGITGIMVLGFLMAMMLSQNPQLQFLIIIFAALIAILIPRYILKSHIKSRQLSIQNDMPNVLDVLCVSIEAGLSFDAALLKVIERFKGPLIEEFSQVYREIQMGKPRREALASLSARSSVPELQTFASAVAQSEQFGTPMKNVLRIQADQLRVNRRQYAQEKGMKAPVKMMLPMVIFIFPVIFIILLGPTIINVLKFLI